MMNSDTKKEETWSDITEEFKKSVKSLKLGELMKTDSLTMLEAMAAVELMDPKMDSGLILKNANRKVYNLNEAININLIKADNLELTELIGIIDDTYACYATWLNGNFLAQTVMTNLYLHNPELIGDRCLKIFCQTILKLLYFTDKTISMISCVEEEDFSFNNDRFNLDITLNDQKILTTIDEVCQSFESILSGRSNKQFNNVKQPQESGLNGDVTSNDMHEYTDEDKRLMRGLIERLRFTQHFFSTFMIINRHIATNQYELCVKTSQDNGINLTKVIKPIQASITNCKEHLAKCLEYLERWKQTIHLGVKPIPLTDDKDKSECDYPTIMGFDPLVNQKLLPPAYPKSPTMVKRAEIIDCLTDLIDRLKYCLDSSATFMTKSSLMKSLKLIENFSKYHRPQSCVLTRSLVQLLYLPNRSKDWLKDELILSMNEFCEPMIEFMKADEVRSEALDGFISESSRSFSQLFPIYGHNSARQQERLPDIIYCLKNLQISALLLNNAFNNSFLYAWATYHLARVAIKYIISSIELELYSTFEYSYIFWYLYENLFRLEHDQLEQTKKYILDTQKFLDESQKKNKNLKGKQKRKRYSTIFHDTELLRNEAISSLIRGIFFLTIGLKKQDIIKSPKMDYTSEQIFFNHRFDILNNGNQYIRYKQQFDELNNLDLATIYKISFEWLSEANGLLQRSELDNEGDLTGSSLLKVCRKNMIVAKILNSNCEQALNNRSVEFTFDLHPSFPTIKIV